MMRITKPMLYAEKNYIRESAQKHSFEPLGKIKTSTNKQIENYGT